MRKLVMLTVKIPSIDILIDTVETRQGSQQFMYESIATMYIIINTEHWSECTKNYSVKWKKMRQ